MLCKRKGAAVNVYLNVGLFFCIFLEVGILIFAGVEAGWLFDTRVIWGWLLAIVDFLHTKSGRYVSVRFHCNNICCCLDERKSFIYSSDECIFLPLV